MRDYRRLADLLERKAADPACTLPEREALLEKVHELRTQTAMPPSEPPRTPPAPPGYAFDPMNNRWVYTTGTNTVTTVTTNGTSINFTWTMRYA